MATLLEYKIIQGPVSDCQKWLNQWKHLYKLTIISMSVEGDVVTILLTRERKDGKT